MFELLDLSAKISVLVFVVSSMLTMGLSLEVREIIAPLYRVHLVVRALLLNFLLVPLLAFLLVRYIPLHPSHGVGLLLLGGAAGAPFLPKLTELVRGDLALSVMLTILLMVGTTLFMPLALPWMIPDLQADFWSLARPLLMQMILPLAIGLLIRAQFQRLAEDVKPWIVILTNISCLLLLILLVGLNFEALLGTIGSGAILVSSLFVGISLGMGYFLGGPDVTTKRVVGLATGQRNIAAALVTATGCYKHDPQIVVMLLVATLAGLVVLLVAASRFRPPDKEKSQDVG